MQASIPPQLIPLFNGILYLYYYEIILYSYLIVYSTRGHNDLSTQPLIYFYTYALGYLKWISILLNPKALSKQKETGDREEHEKARRKSSFISSFDFKNDFKAQ